MGLNEEYPDIFQFLGYFPDADFENLTDEEVVAIYLHDCYQSDDPDNHLKKLKIELQSLMSRITFFWKDVEIEANRHFDNEREALDWLKIIQRELEK